MDFLTEFKVGDKVRLECLSGHSSGSDGEVTEISTRYHETEGYPYAVVHVGEHLFDVDSGNAINPPLGYYIYKIS